MRGRLIALDRIGAGTQSLARQLRKWLAVRDLKGSARAKAVLKRVSGGVAAAWFVGGVLFALGLLWWGGVVLWLISAWVAGGAETPGEPDDEPNDVFGPAELLEMLHDLSSGGARNLHLSEVRAQLAEEVPGEDWHGPATTALCEAAGVRVRKGVRVPGAEPVVTTGIHRHDLPPLPRPLSEGAVGDVAAGHRDNNNTNMQSEALVLVPDMMRTR